ncbi:MAG: acarbose 7IV-phosphotransferase, partial [Micromonosporaceae bacterium]
VDTVAYVPELPLPFADSYQVPAIETRAGQTGDGVALGLHALGLSTMHVDLIGDDHEGRLVRALHERRGAPFTGVVTAAGTKRAVNLVDPAGRRLSLYDARAVGADRLPPDLVSTLARGARHAHVSITHPCGYTLPAVVAAGVSISTDLHDWDGANPYQRTFADQADVVFLSTAALPDHEATMRAILHNGRARVVVATAGAEGGYLLGRDTGEVRRFRAAAPPAPVTDSNGAGDAFVAGFLFGYLAGEPLETCLRYGAVAGAHACTVPATGVDPIDRQTLLARVAGAATNRSRG